MGVLWACCCALVLWDESKNVAKRVDSLSGVAETVHLDP